MPELEEWLEKIGEGAHAQVWKAKDDLGRTVAVKLLNPSVEQFSSAISHAKALARARHPHVVDVYYITEVNHPVSGDIVTAIVMEYLQGKSLDDLLKIQQFTAKEVRLIGERIIGGLIHIHSCGLAHGDFHPGNVIVDETDVKIIDILYLDTLNLLSTMSKETRLNRDCLQLKMLLADLLEHSELDFGEVRSFSTAASNLKTLDEIQEAFYSATDPDKTSKLDRRLEFAYQRFNDPQFVKTESYAAALDTETDGDVIFPLLTRIINKAVARTKHSY